MQFSEYKNPKWWHSLLKSKLRTLLKSTPFLFFLICWFIFIFLLTFLTLLKYMFVLSACYYCCCLMCALSFLTKNILNLNHVIKLKDTVPHFCKIWGACSSHKPWFPNGCPCLMFNLQLHHIKVYVTVFYFYCCIIIRNGEINKLKNYLFIFAKYEESVAQISLLVSQWVF